MTEPPIYQGLAGLADAYDGFIIDLWGVMHDGVQAFPEAVDCLGQLRAAGKRVAILSNAPRRGHAVVARNVELGIAEELADLTLSSGEVTWQHLQQRPDEWYRSLGPRCFQLGPGRDLNMRESLDYHFVEDIEAADFILLTGSLDPSHRVEDYADLLAPALAADKPLICANPDLEVIRGGKREICAGAIAVYYEDQGGRVRSHGKPDRQIYEACLDGLGNPERRRVAAVGDSLRTDIAGALGAGLDGIFVADGIHGEELGTGPDGPDPAALAALLEERGIWPTATLPRLRW
ncbi:MAG: TIGR01459 family HAD-type hydrolase [Pseudomonadota bacterium]